MNYKHIVFDIDNTLISTEYAVLHSLQRTIREVTSRHVTVSDLIFALGIPGEDALLQLGVTDIANTLLLWEGNMKDYSYTIYVYDGIRQLIEKLKLSGYQLGLITSKTLAEYETDFLPFGLSNYFDIVVNADDTLKHKPDAEPIEKYLELSGISNTALLYIGDSIYDMQCAQNANADFGLAVWGCRSPLPVRPTYYFNQPCDVYHLLNQIENVTCQKHA